MSSCQVVKKAVQFLCGSWQRTHRKTFLYIGQASFYYTMKPRQGVTLMVKFISFLSYLYQECYYIECKGQYISDSLQCTVYSLLCLVCFMNGIVCDMQFVVCRLYDLLCFVIIFPLLREIPHIHGFYHCGKLLP